MNSCTYLLIHLFNHTLFLFVADFISGLCKSEFFHYKRQEHNSNSLNRKRNLLVYVSEMSQSEAIYSFSHDWIQVLRCCQELTLYPLALFFCVLASLSGRLDFFFSVCQVARQ